MKKTLVLAGGWFLTIVGGILTPIPMPLPFPFPIGITMLLVGCSILTTHSKAFRRTIQYVRHHNGWLSRGLEFVAHWVPQSVENVVHRFFRHRDGRVSRACKTAATRLPGALANMVHRTSPHAHGRRARMRARNTGDAV
jgi:hypothetical protein